MGLRRLALALGAGLALASMPGCRKESAPVPKADSTAAEKIPAAPAKGILALTLPCGKDSAVSLYDDTTEAFSEYVRHRRVDSVFSDSGYFLERTYYEGGDWLYVSKPDCARLALYGPPIFNPSRTRFATLHFGLDVSYSSNGVQIVSLESRPASETLDDTSTAWGPVSGSWTDDSTFVAGLGDLEGRRGRRTYALRNGTWAAGEAVVVDSAAAGAAPADGLPYPEEERPDPD